MALWLNAVAMVLGVGVGLTVVVFAFMEGFLEGILTLIVPFYALYFVYWVCRNAYVKWLFAVSFLAQAGSLYLLFSRMEMPLL